jgi:GNAT superfamily N-acetyltransferase
MTTKQRLEAKLKARGKTTAEEREQNELLSSPRGMEFIRTFAEGETRLETLMASHPDYQLDYLSFALMDTYGDNLRRLAEFVGLNHEGDYPVPKMIDEINALGEDKKEIRKFLMMSSGFWVLHKGEDLVCVVMMYNGFKLNYITTMVGQRGKGYATFLLSRLREFYAHYGVIYGAINKPLLPLFERCGWTRMDTKDNRDGTINVCPLEFHSNYALMMEMTYRELLSEKVHTLPLLTARQRTMELIGIF